MRKILAASVFVCIAGCGTPDVEFDGKSTGEWIKDLRDDDPSVRISAVMALGEIGPAAEPAVRDLIRVLESDRTVANQLQAAVSLGRIGPAAKAAVPTLVEALDHTNAMVRSKAAEALGLIGKEASGAVSRLIGARARDSDSTVRFEAGIAITRIQSAPAIKHGPMFYVGIGAALVLALGVVVWVRGRVRKEQIPSLVRALKLANVSVRVDAAHSLGALGKSADDAKMALIEALKDREESVRVAADHALAKLGFNTSCDVVDLIMALHNKAEPFVRARAAIVLGFMGAKAMPAVPALTDLVHDDNWFCRIQAIEALGKLGSAARPAVPHLQRALTENDRAIHRAAGVALRMILP